MSTLLTIVILFIVVAGVVLAMKQRHLPRSAAAASYVREDSLLTAAERSFFGALDAAIGAQYRVFAKVRVADVFSVEASDRKLYWPAFNKISARHFDFVICDLREIAPLAVIELNDVSHQRPDRQKRDTFLRELCRDAGLPLIEFAPQRAYKLDVLRQQILTAIGVPADMQGRHEPYAAVARPAFEQASEDRGVPPRVAVPAGATVNETSSRTGIETPALGPLPEIVERREPHVDVAELTAVRLETAPVAAPPRCPKCQGEVQRRKIATGQLAGREFWLCRTFPKCSGMVPLAGA